MTPPLYGSEQRINGTFISEQILYIPIEYNYGYCCWIPRYCWHAYPDFYFKWPDSIELTHIRNITLTGGYTIYGNVGQYQDGNGYKWFTKISNNTASNYIYFHVLGMDDILWVRNKGTNIGSEWYCGDGQNSRIRNCVFQCYPFITNHFNLAADGPREVTLELQAGDYWEYNLGGYIGGILVEFKNTPSDDPDTAWYRTNYNCNWGMATYKKYGFSGIQV